MRKSFLSIALVLLPLLASGEELRVESVVGTTTLAEPKDYHVTSSSPFAAGAVVDLCHPDAWLMLEGVKPSAFLSQWMGHVRVDGKAAVADGNVTVRIYRQGTLVIPHGADFRPLTVYREDDTGGTGKSDFDVDVIYNQLGNWDNAIRSFRLRRGYMVTMALQADGTGFSQCFIADKGDLDVTLPAELAGRVSFLRILQWQYVGKKGWCGGTPAEQTLSTATWRCDWSASGETTADVEYVPHHQSPWWPSFSQINGKQHVSHLLGNNEPDNLLDPAQVAVSVSDVVRQWPQMMQSGLRLGSPACTNAGEWLYAFIDSCDARNYRVDFVALHCYWYNDAATWRQWLTDIHNRVKRPLWITEMNYGANWTGWPYGDDRSSSDRNQKLYDEKMTAILEVLEDLDFVERYCIYNWVEDCRAVILNDQLTPGGVTYARLNSKLAYDGPSEYTPQWHYREPSAFSADYNTYKKTVALQWTDHNGELTDSSRIERSLNGSQYEVIATLPNGRQQQSYTDTLTQHGVYSYRIHTFHPGGRELYSDGQEVNIDVAEGSANFQFGTIATAGTDYNFFYFNTPFVQKPVVINGPISNNNGSVPLCNQICIIRNDYVKHRFSPWSLASSRTMTKQDQTAVLAVEPGNGVIGGLSYEAGTPVAEQMDGDYYVNELGRVNNDTAYIHFRQPFEPCDTPVVLVSTIYTQETYPLMWKVFDVSPEGFKIRLCRELGREERTFLTSSICYLAMQQGTGTFDNGKRITVRRTPSIVGGVAPHTIDFGVDIRATHFWGEPQTANEPKASIIRYSDLASASVKVRRVIDSSESSRSSLIFEDYGWLAIGDDSADAIVPAKSAEPATPICYYTPDGLSHATPQRGVNILVSANVDGSLFSRKVVY